MKVSYVDHRDAAFGALGNCLEEGSPLVILTNDMGAFGLSTLAERFPDNVLNVGIQEQNLMSVASGLALSGVTPVVFGIAAHLIGRAYEQARLDIAYADVHALVLSVGPGLTYGADGPTHQALHEPALLASMPRITYNYPTTPDETFVAVNQSVVGRGLQWLSLDKEVFDLSYQEGVVLHNGWKHVRRNSEFLVLTYGTVTKVAADVSQERELDLIQLTQVLPFPEGFAEAVLRYKRVLVLEEATSPGMLFGMLSSEFESSKKPDVIGVSLPVDGPLGYWSRESAWRDLRFAMQEKVHSGDDDEVRD